uniref:Secreted protein n=1 Tax=Anguilla anguilla TaxID=7936 RepID=A0A0E9X7Q4_ANGAN
MGLVLKLFLLLLLKIFLQKPIWDSSPMCRPLFLCISQGYDKSCLSVNFMYNRVYVISMRKLPQTNTGKKK